MAQCASPARMGGRVYPGVGGALLLPLFAGSACVYAREKEGRLKGLCLLFYKLGLYIGFPEDVHCLRCRRQPHLLSQWWLVLKVWGALRPSSSGLSQI